MDTKKSRPTLLSSLEKRYIFLLHPVHITLKTGDYSTHFDTPFLLGMRLRLLGLFSYTRIVETSQNYAEELCLKDQHL